MQVIICEYHPWDSIFRIGNHHYARRFLDSGWDVLWISHPVSPLHGLKARNEDRFRRAKSGPIRHANGPIEIVPSTFLPFYNAPILSSRWALANSHRFAHPSLGKLIESVGFSKPDLLWITDAVLHFLPDIVNAKTIAVRIADDNVEFGNMPGALKWAEDKLCNRAKVVFATSQPLVERLSASYPGKLHLLRNGVDFAHFEGERPCPAEYAGIEAPIAVYVGEIDRWFALDWVQALAKLRPDITIVLIGRTNVDLSQLTSVPNVKYLGPRPYAELPGYLTHASCGIIPFQRTRLVESVSPLKLFEFMAAGLPVVSTRWRELESLDSPAQLASSADEFVRMVGDAVDRKLKASQGGQYRSFARENSWDARFRAAMEHIGKT